jgi:hypothetical protein
MNRSTDQLQRTTSDFILFAMVFVGFVIGAAGLVTTSIPGLVIGFLLMAMGFCGFMIKGD